MPDSALRVKQLSALKEYQHYSPQKKNLYPAASLDLSTNTAKLPSAAGSEAMQRIVLLRFKLRTMLHCKNFGRTASAHLDMSYHEKLGIEK